MKRILVGFFSLFLLTAAVKPQKAEAGIILLTAPGGSGIIGGVLISSLGGLLAYDGTRAVVDPLSTEAYKTGSLSKKGVMRLGAIFGIAGLALLVADEAEDSISNQILTQFPNITNEALRATSKIVANKAKVAEANTDGIKEIIIDSTIASALVELADFSSDKESDDLYNVLTTKVLK